MGPAKMIARTASVLSLLAGQPLIAQQHADSAALFALFDKNEWCPGGSVYLDLKTGSFMLYPRVVRRACDDPDAYGPVQQGMLAGDELRLLRSAYLQARQAGLRREDCELVLSNGGPELLVITGPVFAARTPDDEGCWSEEAIALHDALFKIFGEARQAVG